MLVAFVGFVLLGRAEGREWRGESVWNWKWKSLGCKVCNMHVVVMPRYCENRKKNVGTKSTKEMRSRFFPPLYKARYHCRSFFSSSFPLFNFFLFVAYFFLCCNVRHLFFHSFRFPPSSFSLRFFTSYFPLHIHFLPLSLLLLYPFSLSLPPGEGNNTSHSSIFSAGNFS